MMTKTKRTIYLVLGSLIFLSAVTIINPLHAGDLFAGFKRFVSQVKVVNGSDMPIPVVVQGGSDNGQGKEIVEITGETIPNAQSNLVYTVPNGKILIITDVLITDGNLGNCVITMDRNSVPFSKPCTPENDPMYRQKYGTGIEFKEGDQIGLATTRGTQFFELRGYLTDIT